MTFTQAQRVLLLQIARVALLEKLGAQDLPAPLDRNQGKLDVPDPAPADAASADPAPADPTPTDPPLANPGGCFVSLHERGTHRLRGCVGQIEAQLPLWQVVRETAGDVLRDPRFTGDRVTAGEVPSLELEVSVLSPPRPAASPLDFDLLNDGIYLMCDGRAGFFLPQVARETGWTKEQLLTRLCQEKLALAPDCWKRSDARLYTFRVEVIGPEPVQA